VHSNGYSLVRKIVERSGLAYSTKAPFDPTQTLGEALLAPTRIYVKSALAAMKVGGIKAFAHITGGGLVENIPRVLPDNVAVALAAALWRVLPVFHWLAETGGVAPAEMIRTFNCGIGMVVVVARDKADAAAAAFEAAGETVSRIGAIVTRSGDDAPRVTIDGFDW
jgi:phosphoribosylformylglycinamidine cyclo-ligase